MIDEIIATGDQYNLQLLSYSPEVEGWNWISQSSNTAVVLPVNSPLLEAAQELPGFRQTHSNMSNTITLKIPRDLGVVCQQTGWRSNMYFTISHLLAPWKHWYCNRKTNPNWFCSVNNRMLSCFVDTKRRHRAKAASHATCMCRGGQPKQSFLPSETRRPEREVDLTIRTSSEADQEDLMWKSSSPCLAMHKWPGSKPPNQMPALKAAVPPATP